MTSNNNIPQGYKQTDLGIIPEDWETIKICEGLADVKSGKRLPYGYYVTDNRTKHPYIRVIDMYDGGIDTSNLMYVPEEAYKSIEKYRIFKDDIFISVAGTLGIVGKIPSWLDGANLTENANRLTNITCCRDYLLYYLRSPNIQDVISSEQTIGAQPKLALNRIRNFEIALPSSDTEQKAIATVLSDVDALITALDKKIAKKKLIKQGAMQQLLTGKKRLPGFTEEWVDTTIGNISELMKGNGLSKEKLSMSGKYKCILYGEIFTYYNYVVEKCKSRTDSREGLKSEIGDVILPGSTTTKGIDLAKAVCIKENDILLGGDVIIIRNSRKEFCSDFLAIYLSEVNKEAIAEKSQGTTIIHLHAPQLAEVKICIPSSIKEQQAIATILSDMDKEISDLETKRDKYRQIKSGMMQKLLTGQIRFRY